MRTIFMLRSQDLLLHLLTIFMLRYLHATLTRSSLACADYLHAMLTRYSLALANYLYATLTRSSLALANILHATLTRSSCTCKHGRNHKGILLGDWWCKGIPSLSKTYQLKPEEVNHAAAGEFVRSKRRGPKPALSVCTGGIGCTWKKIKDKLPLGKINKDQQNTAGTACCERLPRNWKNKRRCEGKIWDNFLSLKNTSLADRCMGLSLLLSMSKILSY